MRKRKQLAFGSGINSMGLDFLIGNAFSGLGTILGGAEDVSNPLDAMFNKMAFGGTVDPPKKKLTGDGSWLGDKGAELLNYLQSPETENSIKTFRTKGKAITKDLVQIADPTGISNYGDTYDAFANNKSFDEKALNVLGSIPIMGKVPKVGKVMSNAYKISGHLLTNILDYGQLATDVTGTGKKKMANGGIVTMENPPKKIKNRYPSVPSGLDWIHQDITTPKGNVITDKDYRAYKDAGLDFGNTLGLANYIESMPEGVPLNTKGIVKTGREGMTYDSPDYNIPKKRLANGGTIGSTAVEVEDQEVAETPLGDIMQFQGNTHEEGGIDVDLPNGTKVFSDRISIDGKTMQERKLKREKSLKKFTKAFEANPTDIVAKNSHDRTKIGLDLEEQHDLAIQEIANRSVQPKKFALGGEVGTDPWEDILKGIIPSFTSNPIQAPFNIGQLVNPDNGETPTASPMLTKAGLSVGTPPAPLATPNADVDASGMTEGDSLGMFGNAFSAITPLLSTLGSSLSDTPNINAFQNFGEDALIANTNAKGQLAAIKTAQDQKLQLSRTGARNRNRNSAGSVNTLRALDAVTDLSGDLASNDIASSIAQQMVGLFNTQSQLENQQDMYQMQGEQQRDVADRQDKGNFDTMLGQSLADIGTGISKTGKDLNTTQANQDLIDIMADMSTNGITYVRDAKTGRLKQKKVK